MQRITKLFLERGNSLLAVGLLGRIVFEAFKQASENLDSELGKLFIKMSSLVPEHYLTGRSNQDTKYKVVSFVDSQSLILIISEAESFFQEALIEVICLHPEKINALGTIESEIRLIAKKYTDKLFRKSPTEYKKELLTLLSADENILDDLWPQFVEAKARRDLGVHNRWATNEAYRRKIKGVGLDEPADAELSVDVNYFLETRKIAFTLMERIHTHCNIKFAEPIIQHGLA